MIHNPLSSLLSNNQNSITMKGTESPHSHSGMKKCAQFSLFNPFNNSVLSVSVSVCVCVGLTCWCDCCGGCHEEDPIAINFRGAEKRKKAWRWDELGRQFDPSQANGLASGPLADMCWLCHEEFFLGSLLPPFIKEGHKRLLSSFPLFFFLLLSITNFLIFRS